MQPVTFSPVSDLIVVLQKMNKGSRRERTRRWWITAEDGFTGLKITLCHDFAKLLPRLVTEGLIVTCALAGHGNMHGVMEIVIPVRFVVAPAFSWGQEVCAVRRVFGDQMHVSVRDV